MTRLYIVDQSGIEIGGHYYSYTGCVAEGARQAGLDVIVFANKRFRAAPGRGDYEIVPCITYTWAEAEAGSNAPPEWRSGNIAYEIFRALRQYPASPADHVFLHTIGYRELLALLDWFVTGLLPGDPIPPRERVRLSHRPSNEVCLGVRGERCPTQSIETKRRYFGCYAAAALFGQG